MIIYCLIIFSIMGLICFLATGMAFCEHDDYLASMLLVVLGFLNIIGIIFSAIILNSWHAY